jgi:hypothetical protein
VHAALDAAAGDLRAPQEFALAVGVETIDLAVFMAGDE